MAKVKRAQIIAAVIPNKRLLALVLAVFLFALTGCSNQSGLQENADNDWLYQLQHTDLQAIAGSGYSTVVIDPTLDGTQETRYTKEEVSVLEKKKITAYAYLSIGEASAYLPYWKKAWGSEKAGVLQVQPEAPDWLGKEPNPSWPESVNVRYWDEAWWGIIEQELEQIVEAGFTGVYLDIVDGYLYWGDPGSYKQELKLSSDPKTEKEAALRMIALVKRISEHAKKFDPGFQVIPQNAEMILDYDDGSYLKAIDGIGIEDLWFDEEIASTDTYERLPYVQAFRDAGKDVLSVDYVLTDNPGEQDEKRILTYRKQCAKQGFSCFAAYKDRELDQLLPKKDALADFK